MPSSAYLGYEILLRFLQEILGKSSTKQYMSFESGSRDVSGVSTCQYHFHCLDFGRGIKYPRYGALKLFKVSNAHNILELHAGFEPVSCRIEVATVKIAEYTNRESAKERFHNPSRDVTRRAKGQTTRSQFLDFDQSSILPLSARYFSIVWTTRCCNDAVEWSSRGGRRG